MATTPKPTPTTVPRQADAAGAAAIQALGLDALSTAGGWVDPTDPLQADVWGRWDHLPSTNPRQADSGAKQSGMISREKAYQKIWEWYGTPEFDKWGNYLVELGVVEEGDKTNPNILAEKWQDAVDASANLTAARKRVDPWDAARLLAGKSAQTKKDSAGGGQWSTRSQSVNLTDPATAKALVNDVLSRQLGRAATDEEVTAFTDVLHQAQYANPTITTQTGTSDENGNTTQSSVTTGGIDAAGLSQIVTDKAMKSPEHGAYQAAATYLPEFFQAIQAPVR